MDLVLQDFLRGKFEQCFITLTKLKTVAAENTVDRFTIQNGYYVVAHKSGRLEKEAAREGFTSLYENLTVLGPLNGAVPMELELAIFNNYLWCCSPMNETEMGELLQDMDDFLSRVDPEVKDIWAPSATTTVLKKLASLLKKIENWSLNNITQVLGITVLMFKLILNWTDVKQLHHLTCCLNIVVKHIKPLIEVKNLSDSDNTLPYLQFECNSSNNLQNSMLLGCVALVRLEEYKLMFDCLRTIYSESVVWFYLAAVASFYLKDLNLSAGFLARIDEDFLLVRKLILQGQIFSVKKDHDKAIDCYVKARTCMKDCSAVYFYLSREYCILGLYDLMVEILESMLDILHEGEQVVTDTCVEKTILGLLHQPDEINKFEGMYALGVAYSLNEQFQEASKLFDKLTCEHNLKKFKHRTGLVTVPDIITIFHESATMKILTGDLSLAEDICRQCVEKYNKESSYTLKEDVNNLLFVSKDVTWIKNLINKQLNLGDVVGTSTSHDKSVYLETFLHVYDEDIVGLMLQIEILKLQIESSEEYRSLLTKTLLLFSRHISAAQKKVLTSKEVLILNLTKSLTAKICLKIGNCQIESKLNVEAERMYKRALSCNPGDKDVLYYYYKYFYKLGNHGDARNLWKTFYQKGTVVNVDDCQSLTLKYLLRTQVLKDEIDKIAFEVNITSRT